MARNPHPEETVNKILDVAVELFMTKGYERTTMQDIVDNLGGLTKGAVYHHFKSKEDIFDAAMNRLMAPAVERLEAIRDDSALTGAQKVECLFSEPSDGSQTEFYQQVAPKPDPVTNARLLGMEYRDALEVSAHRFLQPVIEQGVADGSIQTDYPRELAEILSLLANLWVVPVFYPGTEEEVARRSEFFALLARQMGVDVGTFAGVGTVREPEGAASDEAPGKASDEDMR